MPRTRSSRRSVDVLQSKNENEVAEHHLDEQKIDANSPQKKISRKTKEANMKKKRSISERSPAVEKSRKKSTSDIVDEVVISMSTPTKTNSNNKENDPEEGVALGVTPYWKIAEERGISPRLTRSAQKSERPCNIPRLSDASPTPSKKDDINSSFDSNGPKTLFQDQKNEDQVVLMKDKSLTNANIKQGDNEVAMNRFSLPFSPEGRFASLNDPEKAKLKDQIAALKKKNRELQTNLKIERNEKVKAIELKENLEKNLISMQNKAFKQLDDRVTKLFNDQQSELRQMNNKNSSSDNDAQQEFIQMINELREENKFLQAKLNECESRNIQLIDDLKNHVDDAKDYEIMANSLQMEIHEHKAQREEADSNYKRILNDFKTHQEKESMMKEQVSLLTEENASLERKLAEYVAAMKESELKQKQAAQAFEARLSQQTDSGTEEIQNIRKELDDALSALKQKEATMLVISDREVEMKDMNCELEERCEAFASEIEKYKSKLMELKHLLKTQKSSNEEKLEAIEANEKAAIDSKNNLIVQIEKLTNDKIDLQQKFDVSEEKLKIAHEEIQRLKIEIAQQIEHNVSVNKKYILAEKSNAEMIEQTDCLENKCAMLESNAAKLNATMEKSQLEFLAEKNELLENISNLELELKKNKNDAFEMKKEFESEKKELVSKIEKEIRNNERMNQQMFQSMEQYENERRQKKNDILEKNTMIDELKRRCKAMMKQISAFDSRESALFEKILLQEQIRRCLHNRVMQLSGNIRVFVRVRPLIESEKSTLASPFSYPTIFDKGQSPSDTMAINSRDDLTKRFIVATEPFKDRGGLSQRQKKLKFGFDNVFDQSQSQESVWNATEPLIQSAADGYNVCVFAYGQTGSGKTYTMLGNEQNPGVITNAIKMLFTSKRELEEASKGASHVQISIEMLEIYNEQVRDLLGEKKGNAGYTPLNISLTSNEVVGNVIHQAADEDEVLILLGKAQKRRCVKATKSNSESSRSHLIFTLNYNVYRGSELQKTSKLSICDLAGSERLSKSESYGEALKEAQHINLSLSTLSNVIEKLQQKSSHIPYRESKLTFLLQNSLGGDSKTLAIVCCNPMAEHFQESTCSLRFAQKLNKVELKALGRIDC